MQPPLIRRSTMKKRTMIVLLAIFVLVTWIVVRWANSRSQPRHRLGVTNGQLADCPDTPNCVSTQSSDAEHTMEPIPFTQSANEARARIESIIKTMPRSRIVTSDTSYIHAVVRSPLFGFIDDVEIMIDESRGQIHFRSSSRTGRSDLGVNRSRMEQIRQKFQSR